MIPDTFSKIRRHLQHEVDFVGEQAALREAAKQFKAIRGVRVPKLIPQFCTPRLTAMSEEPGVKVTTAAVHMPLQKRSSVAQHLVEAIVAFPLLSREPNALFHADPHAGNLLYNSKTGELVLLDWALAEHLDREQRRRLTLLFLAVALRNPVAACCQIEALREGHAPGDPKTIRSITTRYIEALPNPKLPRAVDAMGLLEEIALAGVRFPSSLIMFSKVLFTLDGILDDIRGNGTTAEFAIARYIVQRWVRAPLSFAVPLSVRDWLGVEFSALLYAGRMGVLAEEAVTARLFGPCSGASAMAGSVSS